MLKKAKIAVLVSGGGTNLQAIIDAEKAGKIKHGSVTLVISNNPDAYALTRAENSGIKNIAIYKKALKSHSEVEEILIDTLKKHEIDLIVKEDIYLPAEVKAKKKKGLEQLRNELYAAQMEDARMEAELAGIRTKIADYVTNNNLKWAKERGWDSN